MFVTNHSKNKQSMETTKMNRVKIEKEEKRIQIKAKGIFWLERLIIILTVVFPTQLLDLISVPTFIATTLHELYFFFCCPNLLSVGPSGIGGFWLFLLDRFTFYLAFEYYTLLSGGFELTFLWHITVSISFVIHSVYIVEYFLRSHQAVPTPPPPQNDESSGGVCKQLEEMKELVEDGKEMMKYMENMTHSDSETRRKEWGVFLDELSKDGKKMMTYMENKIHSDFETRRKEWGEFLDELSKDGKKMITELDGMICSEMGTLRENLLLNYEKIWEFENDVKLWKLDFNKDIKSMADKLYEIYLVMQETVKEANAIEINIKDQSKERVIRGENVEGFSELKEQVRRMAIEAEIAAEELERETVKLVRAEIHQWEEDNVDYIASLPLLYLS